MNTVPIVNTSAKALKRQSLLVAGACATADVAAYLVQDIPTGGVRWLVALVAVVIADALLATPTRWSGAVAVLSVAVNTLCAVLLGGPRRLGLNEAGVLVASYRAGAWLRGAQAFGVLAALIVGLVLEHLARGYRLDGTVVVAAAKIGLISWLVGRYTTARRAYLDELRRQADEERRDAKESVDRALAEDRAAIARDLHDVITHHVSAINVHAGAARLRLAGDKHDGPALTSLRSVEDASRSALTDLRHMLDLLHGQPQAEEGRRGLGDVDDLLHGLRTAGIPVRLETAGTPRSLPESLDLALYRIAQELLTNALRHGDGGGIALAVRHDADTVELEAVNSYRPGAATGPPGRGLTGIRNRVQLFGGRFRSGPDGPVWRTAVSFDLGEPA